MLKTKDGYAKLIGTTYLGSSNDVLLSNGGSKAISSLSVNYANSAGNADSLDGEHASNFVRAGNIYSNNTDLNTLDTYSFIKSVYSTVVDTSPKGIPGWYNVIQLVHRNGMSDGPNYIGLIALGMTVNMDDMFFRTKRYKDPLNPWNPWKTVIHSGNISSQTVASATKLVTARKIWGQSFDGTTNINGTIYINNNNSENGAIILNNDKNSNARISAIDNEVIFNTGGAIRFGDTDWDYKKWAGLKYALLTKTIYLGIADGSIFTTFGGALSGGTLNLRAGISYIDLNSDTSIRGFGNSTHNSSINFTDTFISLSAYKAVSISSNVGIGTSNPTQKLDVLGNIRASGQIVREASSITWNKGREGALLRETSSGGYHTLWSLKTKDGSWEFGEYNHDGDWNNVPLLSYVTDDDFNNGPNRATYQIKFPLASGTVALTSNILNPTNYYWANVKISNSSSTETSPTVYDLIATNSIRMGDIYLLNGNEINNNSSNLYLNYSASTNINMCHGGGSVIVGPMINNIGNNKLYVNGSAFINGSASINGSTTLNNTVTLNGLVTNRGGILPASYDVNNNGTACYVWGDAMSTGVTAITDALDPRYVSVNYSLDNGTTWTNYPLSNYDKFSLYANNGGYTSIYLGQNRTPDNNGTVSLAQVLKNQLIVTFEIPNSLYSELCWASVDIGLGVWTVCTVEIIGVSGAIENTFTKTMYGWNKVNYINFMGNSGVSSVDIGKNDARFVRFKFKHDVSNTAIRNAQIRKIRLFSFTKYCIDSSDFRSIMCNTGHLYKYDENLNVTFPNTIKATALLIAGNASFYDLYCNTLNHPSSTGTLVIGDKTREVGIRSSNNTTLNALYLYKKLSSNVCYTANKGFCIQPIWGYSTNRLTVSGYTYGYVKVEGGTTKSQTISCIIHSTAISNVRGLLIDFALGADGQILILKNITTNNLYIRPLSCSIIKPDSRNSYLTSGNIDTIVGQNSSHFFVYSEEAHAWMWFRCD